MPKTSRAVSLWCLWIGAGLSLDLAAWAASRTLPVLAADPPGSAGAIALIWIHGFVLPPLFADGGRWARRLLLGVGVALIGVTIIVLSPPQDDYGVRQETGLILRITFKLLSYATAIAPAFGGAVAGLSAGVIAAALPPLLLVSWREMSGIWP